LRSYRPWRKLDSPAQPRDWAATLPVRKCPEMSAPGETSSRRLSAGPEMSGIVRAWVDFETSQTSWRRLAASVKISLASPNPLSGNVRTCPFPRRFRPLLAALRPSLGRSWPELAGIGRIFAMSRSLFFIFSRSSPTIRGTSDRVPTDPATIRSTFATTVRAHEYSVGVQPDLAATSRPLRFIDRGEHRGHQARLDCPAPTLKEYCSAGQKWKSS
jgi:hypothetical protein